MSDNERFWSKVDKSGECWLWMASCYPGGYGSIQINRKKYRAHRFAYELTYGSIPEGLDILHRCDNPACVRPDHLWAGTHEENMADMRAKGRSPKNRGERNSAAKLTQAQADEIRARYVPGGKVTTQLRREFGVSRGIIWRIVHDINWVPEEKAS